MKIFFWLLGVLAFLSGEALAAQENIGSVKTLQGTAHILREGASFPAETGMTLRQGDLLKTGRNSSLGIILRDDTLLSLGSNTELEINEFLFDPAEESLSLIVRMVRGIASYVSGKIAQLAPETVKFETPVGMIGVRGTRFLVQIADP